MKVYICLLLFRIFAYTNSISRIRSKKDHKGVNVLQGTVPEYSNEEYSRDTNNIDNVYNFQTRGTTLGNRNMNFNFRAPRVETLTDFIQEAVYILNTYEDTAFEDFFHILDNEIRKYHYSGCKFSELTQNSDTRSLLAGSLKLIRGKSVSFTKANINEVADMLRDETFDKNVKELLDYINSFYRNTKLNFHSVLNELKYYRKIKSMKTHNNLVQVIRSAVRAILFDHYTDLSTNARRELKERIDTFWQLFKNNRASSSEINYIPYTDPVIKSVVNSIKVHKNPEPYSKNNPQMKLKTERMVSIETYNEQFQDDEPEMNETSNEFEKPATDYATAEISSEQSFDSSSKSIKKSQERHEEYNAQRYMTLYTEEISYKAKTTKKSEIIPISANVTRRYQAKKRMTTMPASRERDVSSDRTEKIEMLRAYHDTDDTKDIFYSSHDAESGLTLESKHEPRAKPNSSRKHAKADESRSKSKQKNAHILGQYDAVIDVQLANTELLKSLGMFEPVRLDTKYDTTLYPRSAVKIKPVPTRNTLPRTMPARAEIKPQKPTAPTKSRIYESSYRKPFDESKRSIVPNVGQSIKQYKKNQNQHQKSIARRSSNHTAGIKDFKTFVIKRIDALENKLKEFKEMNYFRNRMNDNNTDDVDVSNITDKYEANDKDGSKRKDMKGNIINRSLNKNHDLNNKELNKENNYRHTTTSHTMNTESTTNNTTSTKSIVTKMDAVNATDIDKKNTSQVTNSNVDVTNKTNEINKEIITNDATSIVTSVTNTTKLESVVTTPTVSITRSAMAYSQPSYYDYPVPPDGKSKRQLDPFGLTSDGFYVI